MIENTIKRNRVRKTLSTEEARIEFLKQIKNINAICPGCLVDFSMCPDKALLMIFERCHFHGTHCDKRIYHESHYQKVFISTFLACRHCNASQKQRCGYYKDGQLIKYKCGR